MNVAADACRDWEDGGDPSPVADTAWEAEVVTLEALGAVAGIDPPLASDIYPEINVGRLVMAARLLILAGTDEGGRSVDLKTAAQILELAALQI